MIQDTPQLGKYKILNELGKGGFATVYRALDTTLDRDVALKVLDPLLVRDETWVTRFHREAKAVARLKHPHIVTIYEIGEAEDRLFIAMELIEGPSLKERIAERGRLSWDETLEIVTQVADALDYAHVKSIIHRDLKPGNILLDPHAGAVLTDFGFAKLVGESSMSTSVSGGIVGAPQYIAPEVWQDKDPGVQADLYALGCIVYEMLVGEVLFSGKTPAAVMTKHLMDGPQFLAEWPESVPAGVEKVLQKATAWGPLERHENAGELVAVLKTKSTPAKTATMDVSFFQQKSKIIPCWGWIVGAVGLVLAALVCLGVALGPRLLEDVFALILTATTTSTPTAMSTIINCLGTADDAIVDLECREITIAVENAYLPFNYIDPDTGEPAGWDYDVWNEICTRLHCKPIYTETAWEGMIQAVSDEQFDVAADGITITDERAEIVDFSVGYITIDQRLLVRKDEYRISSIDDIVNDERLLLGSQAGTINYQTAARFLPEERIIAFEQFPFVIQALIAGDIDAVLCDEIAEQGYKGENADNLKLVGPSVDSDQLGFIYPKGSDLVDPVNQAINALKSDGTLETLNTHYFGPGFTITYDDLY